MRQAFQKIAHWFERHAKTLDLLGEYTRAVYAQWNDYMWGELAVAPVVIWWIFGSPPMWVTVPAFFWAFLIAGYYVWRKEHVVAPRFKSWIPDMTVSPAGRLFVGMQIVNLGPPTSIHTWQAGFEKSDGGHVYLSDRMLVEDEDIAVPGNIRGNNLRHDYRLFATGETREGWIAFDVGSLSDNDAARAMRTVLLIFTDAFDNQHEISTVPPWARELEK